MYKGTLYIYDNDGNLERTCHNRFVLTGRYFALEAIFPFERAGNTWFDNLSDVEVRHFGCGKGTTSDGVTGPTSSTTTPSGSSGVSTTGTWQGASLYDWQLGDEFTGASSRGTITVNNRVNRTMEIEITITGGVNAPASTDIHEIGIFLGDDELYPAHSPDQAAWDANDRTNGLVARIIITDIVGSEYVVNPINLGNGEDKTLKYVFQDI